MSKKEYADEFMPRAKQDINLCKNEHELQLYIAGLLENIDFWQKEYDYMKKHRDILNREIQELRADYGNKAQVERDLLQLRIDKAISILENIYYLHNVTISNNACMEIDKAIKELKGEKQ